MGCLDPGENILGNYVASNNIPGICPFSKKNSHRQLFLGIRRNLLGLFLEKNKRKEGTWWRKKGSGSHEKDEKHEGISRCDFIEKVNEHQLMR